MVGEQFEGVLEGKAGRLVFGSVAADFSGLFTTLFLLFVRFLPMIPMNEIRMILPSAKIKPKAAAGAD